MLNWLSAKLMTTSVGDFLLAKIVFRKGLVVMVVAVMLKPFKKHEHFGENLNWFWGIWVAACVVFAAIKLSGAQGKNPENRTQAMIGLACAAIGGFVMIKAYDIAAWVTTI